MHPLSVRPRRRVGRSALACTCALALVAGACGSDSSSSSPAATAAPSPAPVAGPGDTIVTGTPPGTDVPATSSPTSDEAAVLAAYQGYWDTYLEANADPVDPQHPGIERYYTGPAKERLLSNLRSRQLAGLAVRLPQASVYMHTAEVVRMEAGAATVEDCATDDAVVYQVTTGAVANDKVETRLIRGELVQVDGIWKVRDTVGVSVWEGIAGCAAP